MEDNYIKPIGETLQDKIQWLEKELFKEKEKNKQLTDEYMIQKHLINAEFLDNYIPKSKVEEILKEKIEWCIKASNSGLNAIQYACSKEDEIERIERQKNISTMISILKEMLQELLDERNNTDV